MLNPTDIVQNGGLVLLAIILFAEVGLFLGFFLPGDTLLIAAGIFAHKGHLSMVSIIVVASLAAIAGDSFSYFIGKKLGPAVFEKDTLFFRRDHVRRAEVFYERYGPKTLLISHFLPVVRSFTPLLAGVGKMPYRRFLPFNVIGDVMWAVVVTSVGYFIGAKIPNADNYIMLLVLAAVVFTFTPALISVLRQRRKRSLKT